MKLLISAVLVGTSAAVAVRAGSCVPGLVRANTPSSGSAISFQALCGAKLDLSRPYGVFAGPNGSSSSFVGAYIPGAAELSADAITIRRDLVVDDGQTALLVTATDENGNTLLQSFTVDDSTPSDSMTTAATTSLHAQRAEDAAATCTTCNAPGILCQPSCQNPPQTCTFYSSCAEAALPCGASGYALGYGLANCAKFLQRQSYFSRAGQAWIFRVLTCLQRFLIAGPLVQCGLTCDGLKAAAFGSHPTCYVDGGVCALPVRDWVQLVLTIRDDLLTLDTLKQAVTTGGQCLGRWRGEILEELGRLRREEGKRGEEDRARVVAEMAVLEAVGNIF